MSQAAIPVVLARTLWETLCESGDRSLSWRIVDQSVYVIKIDEQ